MENNFDLKKFVFDMPKAELHIHIEGSLEPELMFEMAKRNNIDFPYKNIEEIKEKYNFNNLQEFLDIYYEACSYLITELDFEDLMFNYLFKANSQGVKYAEIFFDPQSHLSRNVSFATIINGFKTGIDKAKGKFEIEANLIMCALRHLSEEEALETFELALPYKDVIIGIGLDSSEIGNPPEKFKNLYKLAKEKGFRTCTHCGEEGNVEEYIKAAVEHLKMDRMDHGIRLIEDLTYMKEFAREKIPMTLCPLSNIKLKNWTDLSTFPIRTFLENNLIISINSDDPAYFGGYIADNYLQLQENLNLTKTEIITLAKFSFESTFLDSDKKNYYLSMIDKFVSEFGAI